MADKKDRERSVEWLNDHGYKYRMSGKNGKKLIVLLYFGVMALCFLAIYLLAKLGDYVDLIYANSWAQLIFVLAVIVPAGLIWLIRRSINR